MVVYFVFIALSTLPAGNQQWRVVGGRRWLAHPRSTSHHGTRRAVSCVGKWHRDGISARSSSRIPWGHRPAFPGPVNYAAFGAISAGPDLAAETSGATIVAFVVWPRKMLSFAAVVGSFWRLGTRGCGRLQGALFAQLLSAASSVLVRPRDDSEWFLANGLSRQPGLT